MSARAAFPSPPDLSELLKFFESEQHHARKEMLARKYRQGPPSTSTRTVGSQQRSRSVPRPSVATTPKTPTSFQYSTKATGHVNGGIRSKTPTRATPSTATTRCKKLCKVNEARPHMVEWNSSTQVPERFAKPLKHQILSRTFQPPAPIVVDPNSAHQILKRVSKATISSRMKTMPLPPSHEFYYEAYHDSAGQAEPPVQPHEPTNGLHDTRAKEAIQTLLNYRKEVEKRLQLDPIMHAVDL